MVCLTVGNHFELHHWLLERQVINKLKQLILKKLTHLWKSGSWPQNSAASSVNKCRLLDIIHWPFLYCKGPLGRADSQGVFDFFPCQSHLNSISIHISTYIYNRKAYTETTSSLIDRFQFLRCKAGRHHDINDGLTSVFSVVILGRLNGIELQAMCATHVAQYSCLSGECGLSQTSILYSLMWAEKTTKIP